MSYNGIGLKTARGTGTNGYVRKNASNTSNRDYIGSKGNLYEDRKIKERMYQMNNKRSKALIDVDLKKLEREIGEIVKDEDEDEAVEGGNEMQTTGDVKEALDSVSEEDVKLSGEELRGIEVEVMEYRDKLEDDMDEDEIDDDTIDKQVDELRERLKEKLIRRKRGHIYRLKKTIKNQELAKASLGSSKPYPVSLMGGGISNNNNEDKKTDETKSKSQEEADKFMQEFSL